MIRSPSDVPLAAKTIETLYAACYGGDEAVSINAVVGQPGVAVPQQLEEEFAAAGIALSV
jgi:hypothetical protein